MSAKKDINVSIGEQVKRARENAGLTQEQLAEYIEVSPQYISDMERGIVGASVSTIKKMCEALSVTSDRLLFPQRRDENDVTELVERCRLLSDKHFSLLMEIVNKYIEAIVIERAAKGKNDRGGVSVLQTEE